MVETGMRERDARAVRDKEDEEMGRWGDGGVCVDTT
jgi:hypothetical protein